MQQKFILKKNESLELSDTAIHEARHTWQNQQIPTTPSELDADGDGCANSIANGAEAGPDESSSIQDGIPPTNGDDYDNSLGPLKDDFYNVNPYTLQENDPEVSRCGFLLERDSIEFANDHI